MRNLAVVFFLVLWFTSCRSTSDVPEITHRKISVVSGNGTVEANILIERNKKAAKGDPAKMYAGYYLSGIHYTQGMVVGHPLDGLYQKFDGDNQLMISGKYKDGLKDGLWRKWDKAGKLTESSTYRKGILDGERRIYFHGQPASIEQYKKGELDGKQITFVSNDSVRVERYRNGEKIAKKHLFHRLFHSSKK
ncbi:toxin-antitoxin system YwqK family antitoxin [Prolixibacter sp. NT017]|uniref:toxin-antitoxin system YwqK family antitoxin n=1 Tax=Prolixibacter sp. NT017 TaxID=2652390 RepID=UPI0012990255|nr:hypothetical protein [Prolixibacter sp. NT017]